MLFEEDRIDDTEVKQEENRVEENSGEAVEAPAEETPAEEVSTEETPVEAAAETNEQAEPEKPEPKSKAKKKKKTVTYTRGQTAFISIVAVFIAIVLSTQITYIFFLNNSKTSQGKASDNNYFYKMLEELQGLYETNYLYGEDLNVSADDLLRAYVDLTGDKYAHYYSEEEWYNEQNSLQGTNAGIGAYVAVDYNEQVINVIYVFKDSPAEKAGLKAGDRIVGVDGQMMKDIGVDVGFDSIAGEIGTNVILIVERGGNQFQMSAVRGYYKYESVITKIIEQDGHKIGYMHILQFISTTPNEFEEAANQMKEVGCEGIVIDLRNNPGGQLDAIVDVLDIIEPSGEIVEIYKKDGTKIASFNSDSKELDMPLAVLCNESTASAAELMTRSLMDTGKAESFGLLTYGKGCGQSAFRMSNGAVVYITSFYYKTPQSDNYDGIGITPDHVVEYPEGVNGANIFIIPLEDDVQLQAALNSLID